MRRQVCLIAHSVDGSTDDPVGIRSLELSHHGAGLLQHPFGLFRIVASKLVGVAVLQLRFHACAC